MEQRNMNQENEFSVVRIKGAPTSVTNREMDTMGLLHGGLFANMSVSELIRTGANTADHYKQYNGAIHGLNNDTKSFGGLAVLLMCSALMYFEIIVSGFLLISRQQIENISSQINLILTNERSMVPYVCVEIARVIRGFVCNFLRADIPSLENYINQKLHTISKDLFDATNQAIPEITTAIDHSNQRANKRAGLVCFAKKIVHAVLDGNDLLAPQEVPELFFEKVRVTIVKVCKARANTNRRRQDPIVTKEALQDIVLWVRKELANTAGIKTIRGHTSIPDGWFNVAKVDVTKVRQARSDRNVRRRIA